MRRPSPASTPRRSASRSRSSLGGGGSLHGHGGGAGDAIVDTPAASSRNGFAFDEEQLSIWEKRSGEIRKNSTTATTSSTPPKAVVSLESSRMAPTPTKLQHTFNNIGITTTTTTTTPTSVHRGRGRPSYYKTSPQSSFVLSPTSSSRADASSVCRERVLRWLCKRSVLVVIMPVLWIGIVIGIAVRANDIGGGSVGGGGGAAAGAATSTTIKRGAASASAATTSTPVRSQAATATGHEQRLDDANKDNDEVALYAGDSDSKDKRKLEDGYNTSTHDGRRKGNNDLPYVANDASTITTTDLISEKDAFRKMLERVVNRRNKCELQQRTKRLRSIRSDRAAASNTHPSALELAPFGVIHDLEQYLNSTMTTTEPAVESGRRGCHLPPGTSCHIRNYTVYINARRKSTYSSINTDPRYQPKRNRAILILALRAVALPSSSEVVIAYDGEKENLDWDKKYGRRLLMWHSNPDHPVRILFRGGDGDKLLVSERFQPELAAMHNDAILYIPVIDQEMVEFSSGGIEAGFQLWRRHSDTVILADMGGNGEKGGLIREESQDGASLNLRCPTNSGDQDIGGSSYDWDSFFSAPFFLHQNYACFFDHDVISFLQQALDKASKVENQGIETATIFMHSLVNVISGMRPRLFPPLLHRKRDGTRDITALSQQIAVTTQQTLIVNSVDETENKKEVRRTQRRRRLFVDPGNNEAPKSLSLAISIAAYFGSSISSTIDWCAASGKDGDSMKCKRNDKDPITIDMLPWMHAGGTGYDVCTK